MTLDSKLSKAVYQGNGSTTVFPFAFKVWDSSQIAVTVTDAAGVSTDVTSNSTVTLTSSGGSVTYPKSGSPLPDGAKLAITRNMPFIQGINLTTASRFDPQVLEDGLDQGTAERQQMLEQMARAVILPPTSSESPEDVVASIYASRDAAAASASAASAQAAAAEASAQAAENSASTAAQTVETATADAVSAATAQANAAHDSALAAAQSAAEAEGASTGLAPRMDAVELVAAAAKAVTDTATAVPTANALPKAGSNSRLDPAWVGTMLCNKRVIITTSQTYHYPVTGWYRRTAIAGGGPGGDCGANSTGGNWGSKGGNTSIGTLSAVGGSSGGPGGAGGARAAGAGGAAGNVETDYVYAVEGTSVAIVIGAGGIASTVPPSSVSSNTPSNTTTTGAYWGKGATNVCSQGGGGRFPGGPACGSAGATDQNYGSLGGNGGSNGTPYGGGGGGAAYSAAQQPSPAGRGGANGSDGTTVGGNGGNGAIILEFFDPSVTS